MFKVGVDDDLNIIIQDAQNESKKNDYDKMEFNFDYVDEDVDNYSSGYYFDPVLSIPCNSNIENNSSNTCNQLVKFQQQFSPGYIQPSSSSQYLVFDNREQSQSFSQQKEAEPEIIEIDLTKKALPKSIFLYDNIIDIIYDLEFHYYYKHVFNISDQISFLQYRERYFVLMKSISDYLKSSRLHEGLNTVLIKNRYYSKYSVVCKPDLSLLNDKIFCFVITSKDNVSIKLFYSQNTERVFMLSNANSALELDRLLCHNTSIQYCIPNISLSIRNKNNDIFNIFLDRYVSNKQQTNFSKIQKYIQNIQVKNIAHNPNELCIFKNTQIKNMLTLISKNNLFWSLEDNILYIYKDVLISYLHNPIVVNNDDNETLHECCFLDLLISKSSVSHFYKDEQSFKLSLNSSPYYLLSMSSQLVVMRFQKNNFVDMIYLDGSCFFPTDYQKKNSLFKGVVFTQSKKYETNSALLLCEPKEEDGGPDIEVVYNENVHFSKAIQMYLDDSKNGLKIDGCGHESKALHLRSALLKGLSCAIYNPKTLKFFALTNEFLRYWPMIINILKVIASFLSPKSKLILNLKFEIITNVSQSFIFHLLESMFINSNCGIHVAIEDRVLFRQNSNYTFLCIKTQKSYYNTLKNEVRLCNSVLNKIRLKDEKTFNDYLQQHFKQY
ncbi:hypothetical protein AB837_00266 [bacterium AB1]|nr:hypothetical protein AB837_00266 [bacterium AB1]